MSEPRIIDYRRTTWGHNIAIRSTGDGLLTGHVWNQRSVREGDFLLWSTEYGYARGVLTSVTPCIDPDDMYRVDVKVVERLSSNDETSLFRGGECTPKSGWLSGEIYCAVHGHDAGWPCSIRGGEVNHG